VLPPSQKQWTSVQILTLALKETHLFHSHTGSRPSLGRVFALSLCSADLGCFPVTIVAWTSDFVRLLTVVEKRDGFYSQVCF